MRLVVGNAHRKGSYDTDIYNVFMFVYTIMEIFMFIASTRRVMNSQTHTHTQPHMNDRDRCS